jgi:tRNA (guanine-N7-)-methyltransferase
VRRSNRLPLEQLAPFLLDTPDPPAPLGWRAVFGDDHPVELEVGFGKGLFLLSASQAHPEVNFVGVEIARKYQLFTATRIAKRGLCNVRLARADARIFMRDRIGSQSLRAVHIYFPDPWWKKRHMKRRVFTTEFVGECSRVLRAGGHLHAVTDVQDYFGEMTRLVGEQPCFRQLAPPDSKEPSSDLDYLTNFERKFRKEGKPIYRASWERS